MTLDLDRLHLERGPHPAGDGLCVMEAAALFAGERQSDRPACVSPVIGAFLRRWNDALDDDDRQQLKPLIPVIVGSASTADDDDTRRWLCADWLVRVYVPAWLRAAGIAAYAAALEALPALDAEADMQAVMPVLTAARDAALDAAWARMPVLTAARDAALDAAWARDAALDAAWARDAALDAAWARDAALDAAWAAARAAAPMRRPTVETLQTSALDLVRRMAGRQ